MLDFLEVRVRFELTALRICNPTHWTTLAPHYKLATREGFEPPTFGFGDQRSARLNYRAINWSGRRGSNSRHLPWQGNALPAELLPHNTGTRKGNRTPLPAVKGRCPNR